MALLSADDVLNKTFQSVKFREGYDQVEVDEFLDEVVATIYALTVENAELKEKLAAAEQRAQGAQSGEGAYVAPEAETVIVEAVTVEPEPEPVVEQPAPAAEATDQQAAASMLALAQRLHDEYVNDGREEGERIVAEAHEKAQGIVSEANSQRDEVLTRLTTEKAELEDSINSLRGFEADYRASISEHLQKLLSDLQSEAKPA
ncbi:DivIVA domain-containing protein [Actinomyces minihominis]|uniref:DivIVA domain-containing protein n=1 Tax=Actinomyces minihominis TaxID=2002838 RepID=UPI000C08840A|nr:DivIVA domain-containing protein [Actinomyces minihominis]